MQANFGLQKDKYMLSSSQTKKKHHLLGDINEIKLIIITADKTSVETKKNTIPLLKHSATNLNWLIHSFKYCLTMEVVI